MSSRVLVVDNYDSFTYNLVQYLQQLGADVTVRRNDETTVAEVREQAYAGVLLSPGPGTPERAGCCVELIRELGPTTPVFGVCLGLQAITVAYGGVVDRAEELMHGKTSEVFHDGEGVFAGLPSPFTATRYHSLAAVADTVPEVLHRTAWTDRDIIMGMRHTAHPVEGVQFHPESVLTQHGHRMLATWLTECGDPDAAERAVGLAPVVR